MKENEEDTKKMQRHSISRPGRINIVKMPIPPHAIWRVNAIPTKKKKKKKKKTKPKKKKTHPT
jgi:hypothetical protein